MSEQHNRVVRITGFGGPEGLEIAEAPMPTAGPGEVRVRVLASGLEYTDVVTRRHLYPQTMYLRPPFVMGYEVVGEIDQVGAGVTRFQVGDVVADMTVVGSNAALRTLEAADLTRVPAGVDPAEAAALILSWTTAYQLLHRVAQVRPGQKVLVLGAAGALGQALLTLGGLSGLKLWGAARQEHAGVVRDLGATPVDHKHEAIGGVSPGGFDVVFDGVGESDFAHSLQALRPGGVLCAYGYSASVQEGQRLVPLLLRMARRWIWTSLRSWSPGGKHIRVNSINLMRARHPAWFRQNLQALLGMLATRKIRPRVAKRISFEQVREAHKRLEEGHLEGKLVLCPDLAMAA